MWKAVKKGNVTTIYEQTDDSFKVYAFEDNEGYEYPVVSVIFNESDMADYADLMSKISAGEATLTEIECGTSLMSSKTADVILDELEKIGADLAYKAVGDELSHWTYVKAQTSYDFTAFRVLMGVSTYANQTDDAFKVDADDFDEIEPWLEELEIPYEVIFCDKTR